MRVGWHSPFKITSIDHTIFCAPWSLRRNFFFSELRSSRKCPYPPSLKWWRHKPIRQYITAKCIMGRLHNPPLTGMLTLSFQILTYLCFNENESWCRNCNLTEEESSSQCLKILTPITIEDGSELAEIREVFPKKINDRILRQRQQTYLEKLLCLL